MQTPSRFFYLCSLVLLIPYISEAQYVRSGSTVDFNKECKEIKLTGKGDFSGVISKVLNDPDSVYVSMELVPQRGQRRDKKNACVQGYTFGFTKKVAYARKGCRGVFLVCVETEKQPKNTKKEGRSYQTQKVAENCEEVRLYSNGQPEFKDFGSREILEVSLIRDKSGRGKECIDGETYAWNTNELHVWDGCKGVFSVCFERNGSPDTPRDGGKKNNRNPPPSSKSSPQGECKETNMRSRNGARTAKRSKSGKITSLTLLKDYSDGLCVEGQNYGFTEEEAYAFGSCEGRFQMCTGGAASAGNEKTGEAGEGRENAGDSGEGEEGKEGDENEQGETPSGGDCTVANIRSVSGVKKAKKSKSGEITSVTLLKEFSRNKCFPQRTYGFTATEAYAKSQCQGRFRICTGGAAKDEGEQGGDNSQGEETQGIDDVDFVELCISERLTSTKNKDSSIKLGLEGHTVTIQSVEVSKQISKVKCKNGKTFSTQGNKVVAKKGCVADFKICYKENFGGDSLTGLPDPEPTPTKCKFVTVKSKKGKEETAEEEAKDGRVPFIESLEVDKELSNKRCKEWKTFWGQDNKVVVKDGCEARFKVCYGAYKY